MSTPLENYNALVQGFPEVERKGKTTPYTSMNGHMFSFLSKEGDMGLRLSKEDLATFLTVNNSEVMMQHGRVMKEYVRIPNALLENTQELSFYLEKSLGYVSSLKPKPTKKKT